MKKILFGLAAISFLIGLTFIFSCATKVAPEKPIRLLVPESGATGVGVTDEMTWELRIDPGSNFFEYDVFLDTDNPPTKMVATHLSVPSFYPILLTNTTYYWSVSGKDYGDGSTIESEVWKFTTAK